MMSVLLAPHNDDESLFAAYTILRERPLVVVVTDSWVQFNRGDPITAEQRREETKRAMGILKCPYKFLGIRDDEIIWQDLEDRLKWIPRDYVVYAPAIQGGHRHHDLIGRYAMATFPRTILYTTYTKNELWTKGEEEVIPTQEEIDLKNKALSCYESQININRPHFEAVVGKSEWLNYTWDVEKPN